MLESVPVIANVFLDDEDTLHVRIGTPVTNGDETTITEHLSLDLEQAVGAIIFSEGTTLWVGFGPGDRKAILYVASGAAREQRDPEGGDRSWTLTGDFTWMKYGSDFYPLVNPYRPGKLMLDHAKRRGWDDLTDDHHRCLWVMEKWLAQTNNRIYHIEQFTDLEIRRVPGFRPCFQAPMLRSEISSFDFAGLDALTVAAFAAGVRVQIGSGTVYYDRNLEEPRRFWTEAEAERYSRQMFLDDNGPLWIEVNGERTPILSYPELSITLRDEVDPDFQTATYGRIDFNDCDVDIRERPTMTLYFHARNCADDTDRSMERHPGTEHLIQMINDWSPEALLGATEGSPAWASRPPPERP